jgi:SRSO17 transposase
MTSAWTGPGVPSSVRQRVPLGADPVRAGQQRGRGHWLLARRSLSEPEGIAYYACYGPRQSSTADLAWTAGSRWHVEECIQQAKGEAGLDQYQVRTWRAWYAHVTLSMLALAWLAASRAKAEKRGPAPATPA